MRLSQISRDIHTYIERTEDWSTVEYIFTDLGDHLEAASSARSEVCGRRGGGQQGLLAVLLGGEVGHVTQEPVHQLHVPVPEGCQESRLASVVTGLCST